ncbi:6-phosphogluconolactonase [Acidimicrobiaceae bacterium]|jgi:6-phosphogluconolactonase|nr:6-phosphogluconolactonase [Acidimicrobiia bacterium]MDA7572607.1 6-phosphogluconolactonase [bacterium]MDA7721172.1 6-phosphogluconolactonase [Acidimicrobiaceae bacterium]MDA8719364.1 6-phosphogluconolactonase [Candidatus Actinomarina sp.]MDA7850904.1 6-phosphogluconolactonase [Acidimicrobiaceae bacterium]|tara:strand:- start:7706 stop:8374 length:669 start_codon:yes stop_codon:yes gene_type:complete
MSESIIVYKANDHLEASSCLSNLIINEINKSKKNSFTIGLSGGSTPKITYSLLKNDIQDLSKIIFWTVDERWVPRDDEYSNQKMINSFFADSTAKILEVEYSGLSAERDANKYASKLENNITNFDTVILGVGEDGHIASLFPDTVAVNDTENFYVSNEVNILSKWRVTATFKLLKEVDNVYLLVTGNNKKEILKSIMNNGNTSANKLINERKKTILITDQEI